MSKSKISKALQNRGHKCANAGERAMAAVFSQPAEGFVTHEDGTVERVGNAPTERAVYFLKGRRVYDREEMLEFLNKWWVGYMVQAGYARKIGHLFWITKKCAEAYGLQNETPDGMKFQFVD